MTFLRKKMILKAKWGNWYFEKFSCKNGFFLFFSAKNWEIVQFHLGQNFCSVKFRQDSLISPKQYRVRAFKTYYIIWWRHTAVRFWVKAEKQQKQY
jgi:hypothetical protein